MDSYWQTADEHLIHYATEAGALLLDGFGDGVCFGMTSESYNQSKVNGQIAEGRTYLQNQSTEQFINNTAFSILQATRTRISKQNILVAQVVVEHYLIYKKQQQKLEIEPTI